MPDPGRYLPGEINEQNGEMESDRGQEPCLWLCGKLQAQGYGTLRVRNGRIKVPSKPNAHMSLTGKLRPKDGKGPRVTLNL